MAEAQLISVPLESPNGSYLAHLSPELMSGLPQSGSGPAANNIGLASNSQSLDHPLSKELDSHMSSRTFLKHISIGSMPLFEVSDALELASHFSHLSGNLSQLYSLLDVSKDPVLDRKSPEL